MYFDFLCLSRCRRSQQGLIHKLESGPELRPVKEYKRSAAGVDEELEISIRVPEVLQATIHYLFNYIVPKGRSLETHYFVVNRLRAVQQDLFKQQCGAQIALPILEPIVRYYAWSAYWYSEEAAFDKHNHDIVLLETLKDCLRLSDEYNFPASVDIEALYILYALGEQGPLIRALNNPIRLKDPLIFLCYKLSLYWILGNYVAVCKRIEQLPIHLAALTSVKHLEIIRRHGLNVMSSSHSCRNSITPFSSLVVSHLFSNETEAEEACRYYGVTIQSGGIIFRKSLFNPKSKLRPFKRPLWIQKKLSKEYLPNLLFNEACEVNG